MLLQQDGRYQLRFEFPSHRPYENNLHHIVRDFCKSDFDFWLSMDSDNPPMKNPLDLVELDKDVLGLPTPVWHYTNKPGERPIYWNAYDYVVESDAYREHPTRDGLQRVDAIGTGCFLLARRVFDHPGMREAPFRRKLHPDGTVHKGNDISFCERARARGFEIWAHYGYPCWHYNDNIELAEVESAIRGLWEGVPRA
jgi:GT2 family glycosyltransferase